MSSTNHVISQHDTIKRAKRRTGQTLAIKLIDLTLWKHKLLSLLCVEIDQGLPKLACGNIYYYGCYYR